MPRGEHHLRFGLGKFRGPMPQRGPTGQLATAPVSGQTFLLEYRVGLTERLELALPDLSLRYGVPLLDGLQLAFGGGLEGFGMRSWQDPFDGDPRVAPDQGTEYLFPVWAGSALRALLGAQHAVEARVAAHGLFTTRRTGHPSATAELIYDFSPSEWFSLEFGGRAGYGDYLSAAEAAPPNPWFGLDATPYLHLSPQLDLLALFRWTRQAAYSTSDRSALAGIDWHFD